MKKDMEILSSEAVENENLFFDSNSDNKKPSVIHEETEYLKQKDKEWLKRQYKSMKMEIQLVSNEAVEDEDLFFDSDSDNKKPNANNKDKKENDVNENEEKQTQTQKNLV